VCRWWKRIWISPEDMFPGIARDCFREFLSGFGLTLREDLRTRFIAESPRCELLIGYNYNHVSVGFRRPNSDTDPYAGFIEIQYVLEVLAPHLTEAERFPAEMTWRSNDSLCAEARRLVRLVVQYCQPLLLGDLDAWAKVEKHWSDWWAFLRQSDSETKQEFADRLREAAEAALQKEEYWKARWLYLRMPSEYRTRQDRGYQEEAGRRAFVMR
jgi:hypothetical protein